MAEIYHQVSSLDEALKLLEEFSDNSKIIAGATDFWLEYKNGLHENVERIIDISRIRNFDEIKEIDDNTIHLGPLVTHAHCIRSGIIQKDATCLFEACLGVGSPQIRNKGTIAGNVVTGSPANDTIAALMALDANIVVTSIKGSRIIPIINFYLGVRKTQINKNEIVTDIWFNKTGENSFSFFKKQGLRKAQAISLLNVSVVCKYNESYDISDMRIAFGSLSPTVVRAREAEEFANGQNLRKIDLKVLIEKAIESISPISDIRSTSTYRSHMAGTLLRRGLEWKIKNIEKSKNEIIRNVTLWGKSPSPYNPLTNSSTNKNKSKISFLLNDEVAVAEYIPGQTALDIIRNKGILTGTKEGCGEGECGACTIFMNGVAVLACLIPAPRVEGTIIQTIEYLSKNGINKVQKAFIEENAVQCGFCTPGFVMSATKLLEELPKPTDDEIKMGISGNLCRCTGYYKIVTAIQKAAEMS
jgi:xanthine dehydrogenase iron-sulfur cluster and FAD-binding subunit A